MKRPSEEEIQNEINRLMEKGNFLAVDDNSFIAGINYALEYNNEEDYLKVYNIGFDIDVTEIVNILENDNHLWSEYNPSYFEEINWVQNNTDELEICLSMKYESMTFNELYIFIDDKARVTISMGDTPWEASGVEDEIEEALMSYLTKQKYG